MRLLICTLMCFLGNVCCNDKFVTPLMPSTGESKNVDRRKYVARLPSVMKRYYPQGKHLKEKKLLRRLGDNFDENWMAIAGPKPPSESQVTNQGNNIRSEENRELLQAILIERNVSLTDSNIEPVLHVLSSIASCKVRYEWSDLGELFWPRFVKSGLCTSEHSCSWPSGMTCMPGRLKEIRILRWRCKRRKAVSKSKPKQRARKNRRSDNRSSSKLACSWKVIPYNVPVDCACSC